MRFLISCGDTSTLLRHNDLDKSAEPIVVIDKREPPPITMHGMSDCGGME